MAAGVPKEELARSRSLPTLSAGSQAKKSSRTYGATQSLVTVQVSKNRVLREAVGVGTVKAVSDKRLPFVAFERGIEWERANARAEAPPAPLPPLAEVLRSALEDLHLTLPASRRR